MDEIVKNDIYVDKCITGEECEDFALIISDQLELVLNRGGFQLKGVAFSGEDPPGSLSDDGVSIHVSGMIKFTKKDLISLNILKLNVSKKQRRK